MSGKVVRIAGALLVTALLGSRVRRVTRRPPSRDDKRAPARPARPATTGSRSRSIAPVASRKADSFCEPATEEPSETPTATDDGITADVDLDHAHPRHARGPRRRSASRSRSVIRPTRRRSSSASSTTAAAASTVASSSSHLVEAPPLAPAGQDPAAIAQAACIKATEDNKRGVRILGQRLGRPRRRRRASPARTTPSTSRRTTSREEDLAGADNRLYSFTLSSADGLEYLARRLDCDKGVLEGKTIGVVMPDAPGRSGDRRAGPARHARGAGCDREAGRHHRLRAAATRARPASSNPCAG